MSKPLWTSRLFWVGLLGTLSSFLTWLVGQEWVAAHPDWVTGIGMLSGLVVILLRTLTTQPVHLN